MGSYLPERRAVNSGERTNVRKAPSGRIPKKDICFADCTLSQLPSELKTQGLKTFSTVNSLVDPTFAVNQLCSIETKYSFLRCSIQAVSKYVPAELRPEDIGVPVDLIRATFKDLLQSHRVVCRQKSCCLATSWVVFWSLGFAVLFSFFVALMILCAANPPEGNQAGCIAFVLMLFAYLIGFSVCCVLVCKKCYLKKYVARHLVNEESTGTTEHRDIQDSGQTVAPNDKLPLISMAEEPPCSEEANRFYPDLWSTSLVLLSFVWAFTRPSNGKDLTATQEQLIPNANAINRVMPEEAEYIVDVADDEPLLSIQETDSIDYEIKALDMLLSCTPEYFALAYAKKLKNLKEDRHGIEFLCLCQYLEKVDKDFRKKVKTMQSLRRRRNIEDNNQDENEHLRNISLY